MPTVKMVEYEEMLGEVMAVVGMSNQTNKLVDGYRVEVDEQFLETNPYAASFGTVRANDGRLANSSYQAISCGLPFRQSSSGKRKSR